MMLVPHRSDATTLRQAFGHFPSGVAALAATVDGADRVLVASSFTVGVSLTPPLVMFAVQKTSTTWPHLREAERIGVSVLADGQAALCRQLAVKDSADRWAGVEAHRRNSGALLLDGAAVSMECAIYAEHPAGDHDVIVLEVGSLLISSHVEPLVFHGSRFRSFAA